MAAVAVVIVVVEGMVVLGLVRVFVLLVVFGMVACAGSPHQVGTQYHPPFPHGLGKRGPQKSLHHTGCFDAT